MCKGTLGQVNVRQMFGVDDFMFFLASALPGSNVPLPSINSPPFSHFAVFLTYRPIQDIYILGYYIDPSVYIQRVRCIFRVFCTRFSGHK